MTKIVYTGMFGTAVFGQHEFPRGVPIPVTQRLADKLLKSRDFERYDPEAEPQSVQEAADTWESPAFQPSDLQVELHDEDELDGFDEKPLYD